MHPRLPSSPLLIRASRETHHLARPSLIMLSSFPSIPFCSETPNHLIFFCLLCICRYWLMSTNRQTVPLVFFRGSRAKLRTEDEWGPIPRVLVDIHKIRFAFLSVFWVGRSQFVGVPGILTTIDTAAAHHVLLEQHHGQGLQSCRLHLPLLQTPLSGTYGL